MLDLSNGQGAPIGDMQGIGTITNDDAAPVVSVANASVVEGNAGTSLLQFAVSLSAASDVDASIDFATAGATATRGSDFVAASGTLTIPAGATTGTVDVVVNGDVVVREQRDPVVDAQQPHRRHRRGRRRSGDDRERRQDADDAHLEGRAEAARRDRRRGSWNRPSPGHRVTATLFRKQGTRFVKVSAKTVPVRYLQRSRRRRQEGRLPTPRRSSVRRRREPTRSSCDSRAPRPTNRALGSRSSPSLAAEPTPVGFPPHHATMVAPFLDHRTSVRYGDSSPSAPPIGGARALGSRPDHPRRGRCRCERSPSWSSTSRPPADRPGTPGSPRSERSGSPAASASGRSRRSSTPRSRSRRSSPT